MAEQLDPELGLVGRVIASDPSVLDALDDSGLLPVVACVAGGRRGQVFNVNGDSMAVAIASRWGVDRLVFSPMCPERTRGKKEIIPILTVEGCKELIESSLFRRHAG